MMSVSVNPAATMKSVSGPRNAGWWAALAVLCGALIAPLALVDVPPLLDYPNHLARLFVLAADDPVLARFYQPHWGIIPNLALDLTVPPLLRLFPVHDAGRMVVGVILLLPVAGAVAYHRALTGRLSGWPLASVLFIHNGASLRGFLNFVAALGVALLLAAAWGFWRETAPRRAITIGVLGAVGLFFCHLTGLVFFAVLLAAHEVTRWRAGAVAILRRAVLAGSVFVLPLVLYALSDLHRMDGAVAFRSAAGKAEAAMTPVLNYWWPLDVVSGVLCIAIPALCLVRRWCVIPPQAGLSLIVLVGFFFGLPTAFKGTFDLDTRFIVMAAALAPATLVSVAMPRRVRAALMAIFAVLFTVRMAIVVMVWHAWAGDLARFRTIIGPVRPGDVVLTVRLPDLLAPGDRTQIQPARRLSDGTSLDTHWPALLLIEHRAWWPYLFDNASQQPIETREPYRSLAARVDADPDPIMSVINGDPGVRLFTHVLIVGEEADLISFESGRLRKLTGTGDAVLFRVVSPDPVTPEPAPPPDR